mgnify:CR=1 FL=1
MGTQPVWAFVTLALFEKSTSLHVVFRPLARDVGHFHRAPPVLLDAAAGAPPKPPSPAEMIECTFVRACMDLSTGQVDTLKLFIVSVKAAFLNGATIPAVERELSECAQETAGRALLPEEVELRSLWLCLVSLTLEAIGRGGTADEAGVPSEICKYAEFVRNVVGAKERGAELKALKLEELLGDELVAPTTPVELAVLSQSMRLVPPSLSHRWCCALGIACCKTCTHPNCHPIHPIPSPLPCTDLLHPRGHRRGGACEWGR